MLRSKKNSFQKAGIVNRLSDPTVNPMDLSEIQSEIETWAKAKGWWNPEGRNPLELLMLITTEIAECAEAFRHGNPPCDKPGMSMYSNAEEELADVIIRVLHMGQEFNFDIAGCLLAKMRCNWKREHRHGGKVY